MTASPLIAGVELGGTKCVCILGAGPHDIRERVRIATTSPTETLAALQMVLDRWRRDHGARRLGIASFGPLQLDRSQPDFGRVINTSKAGWSGADLTVLATDFEDGFSLDTDVNGAALAEGLWGAARSLQSYAYVTVGTGVGVGVVVGGRTVVGLGHTEAGHLRVGRLKRDDFPGVCSYHGDCVEGLASGPAILARSGRPGETLSADASEWDGVIHALAGLLHNLVLTTAPQRILIGGGVFSGQDHLFPRLRHALTDSLAGYATAPRIAALGDAFVQPPELGDLAGPLGALAVAMAEPPTQPAV